MFDANANISNEFNLYCLLHSTLHWFASKVIMSPFDVHLLC